MLWGFLAPSAGKFNKVFFSSRLSEVMPDRHSKGFSYCPLLFLNRYRMFLPPTFPVFYCNQTRLTSTGTSILFKKCARILRSLVPLFVLPFSARRFVLEDGIFFRKCTRYSVPDKATLLLPPFNLMRVYLILLNVPPEDSTFLF